jgi:hypothetical protein
VADVGRGEEVRVLGRTGDVGTGGPASGDAWTTPVGSELKLAVPSAFVAITRERIVWPTSAAVSTYVLRVSPEIVSHLTPLVPPPDVSQRSQR